MNPQNPNFRTLDEWAHTCDKLGVENRELRSKLSEAQAEIERLKVENISLKSRNGALDLANDEYVKQVGTWKIIQRLEEQVKTLEDEAIKYADDFNKRQINALAIVNRDFAELNSKLEIAEKALEKIDTDFVPTHQREEPLALEEMRDCARAALTKIRS